MILACHCNHVGQDTLHGEGMRVHNPAFGSGQKDKTRYRCTVCSDLKFLRADEVAVKKEKKSGKKGSNSSSKKSARE